MAMKVGKAKEGGVGNGICSRRGVIGTTGSKAIFGCSVAFSSVLG